jgi:hypothetical protein
MDHTYGSHTFPSVKAMHVRVDISMSQGCREDTGVGATAAAIISEVFIMGVDVRPLTTIGVVQPTQDRRIVLPDESGTVLTDTSTFSSITTVGALSSGSLVTGFGPATIDNGLTSSGAAVLQGDVTLGDSTTDSIYLRGSLIGQELNDYAGDFNDHITAPGSVPAWATDGSLKYGSFVEVDVDRTNNFELKLALIDPSADRTITFPDETGAVLTTSSQSSALTTVSQLVAGSIGVGFGDISIGDPANPISASQTLTVVGLADLRRDVNLGVNQADTISINGKIATDSLVFKSDTSARAGTVTLDINRPALASTERTIVLPDWDPSGGVSRTLATTDDSVMSSLETVGSLSSGSIVAGFGSITTSDDDGISTTGSSPITAAGALTASAELVMAGIQVIPAADNIPRTVAAGKSVVRVEGSAGMDQFTLSLPTQGPAGGPVPVGQTVIVRNDNQNRILVGSEALASGVGGVYIYTGVQWSRFV